MVAQSIIVLAGKTYLCLPPFDHSYLTRIIVSASRLHFLPKPLTPYDENARERETTASIKRYISGHYTANPGTFRKLLIWIIAFVDHFIASFVTIPSYFHLLWFSLRLNLLNLGIYFHVFRFNSSLLVLSQHVSVKHTVCEIAIIFRLFKIAVMWHVQGIIRHNLGYSFFKGILAQFASAGLNVNGLHSDPGLCM